MIPTLIGYALKGWILASSIHHPPLTEDHIAEEDIDPSTFDTKAPVKKQKPSPLDDINFVSEADKKHKIQYE